MVEQVDTRDLKSLARKGVRVRFPFSAIHYNVYLYIDNHESFSRGFLVFRRAHQPEVQPSAGSPAKVAVQHLRPKHAVQVFPA